MSYAQVSLLILVSTSTNHSCSTSTLRRSYPLLGRKGAVLDQFWTSFGNGRSSIHLLPAGPLYTTPQYNDSFSSHRTESSQYDHVLHWLGPLARNDVCRLTNTLLIHHLDDEANPSSLAGPRMLHSHRLRHRLHQALAEQPHAPETRSH